MVGGPKCYFAGFSNEFCKQFKNDPNIVPSQTIPLFWSIRSLDNNRLTPATSAEEIAQVMYQLSPLEGSGLDGMYTIFYQKCWNILNKNVYSMIKAFLKHGHLFRDLNRTILP